MILNRDRFAILSDIWGRFRSLSLISPMTPTVGPGDDGFLWIDIGVDGTPETPLWKVWDEAAGVWRLVGGGAGAVDWDSVTGKPTTFPPQTHSHVIYAKRGWFLC